jgi:lipopolysaccharide heptosyltransferase II
MTKAMNKQPLKILIISPAWVGDTVMMHSLLRYLKQNYPSSILHVVANASVAPLTQYMPEVSKTIVFSFRHGELGLTRRYRFGKKLREENYDQAIILPNSFKSALIPFFAHIPKRTGWRGEWRYGILNDIRILNKQRYPLMIERFLALGSAQEECTSMDFWPRFQVNQNDTDACVERFNIDSSKPMLALCPGAAYGPAKQWPAEYFANVAVEKAKQGFQVIILGAKSDYRVAERITQSIDCFNLVGKTTLSDAVHLLSCSTVVITNDSGLMHIAAALSRPIVAIYGSSTPTFTPPLSKRVTVFEKQLSCRPCFKRICPLTNSSAHMACLKNIKPTEVLMAIEELLQ